MSLMRPVSETKRKFLFSIRDFLLVLVQGAYERVPISLSILLEECYGWVNGDLLGSWATAEASVDGRMKPRLRVNGALKRVTTLRIGTAESPGGLPIGRFTKPTATAARCEPNLVWALTDDSLWSRAMSAFSDPEIY